MKKQFRRNLGAIDQPSVRCTCVPLGCRKAPARKLPSPDKEVKTIYSNTKHPCLLPEVSRRLKTFTSIYWRASLAPPTADTPAPIAYIVKVVAAQKLVVFL